MADFVETAALRLKMIGLEEGMDYRFCSDQYHTVSLLTYSGEARLFLAFSYGNSKKIPSVSDRKWHLEHVEIQEDKPSGRVSWKPLRGDSGYILLFDWRRFKELCAQAPEAETNDARSVPRDQSLFKNEKLWGLISWNTFMKGLEKKLYCMNGDCKQQVFPCVRKLFGVDGCFSRQFSKYRSFEPVFFTAEEIRHELCWQIGLRRYPLQGKDWLNLYEYRSFHDPESKDHPAGIKWNQNHSVDSPWNLGLYYDENGRLKANCYVGRMPLKGTWAKGTDVTGIPMLQIDPRCGADPLVMLENMLKNTDQAEKENLFGWPAEHSREEKVWGFYPRSASAEMRVPREGDNYFINMDLLFEYYCRALIRKTLEIKGWGWTLVPKGDIKLFRAKKGEKTCFMVDYKPDMIIQDREKHIVAVLDAKNSPLTEKKKIRDSTLQVGFYMLALGCHIGSLIGWTSDSEIGPDVWPVLKNGKSYRPSSPRLVSLLLKGNASYDKHMEAMGKLMDRLYDEYKRYLDYLI